MEALPNVLTANGTVHAGAMRTHRYSGGKLQLIPACGAGRGGMHYAIPTDAPITCKRCGKEA